MATDTDQKLIEEFEAALAVLVADGGQPLQLHVHGVRRAYARAAKAIASRLCRGKQPRSETNA